MNLTTIKNLNHKLKYEQKSFLDGNLQQDHEETFRVVGHLDLSMNNTSLGESVKIDIINTVVQQKEATVVSILHKTQKIVIWEH